MRIVLQRVDWAKVHVEQELVGAIERGFMLLVCAEPEDTQAELDYFARKIAKMRLFSDENGKMNKALHDVGGSILAVSQFTLAGQWRNGNRPGFSGAAPADQARQLFDGFCEALRKHDLKVETGCFGAHMDVTLHNDGPVTMILDGKAA